MRISDYDRILSRGDDVTIDVDDEDGDPLVVLPQDPDDPDAGFEEGITAAETVEFQRALTAWLAGHARLFPEWHKTYRDRDPGGLPPERKADRARRQGRR